MHAMSNRYDDLILHLKLNDIDSTNTTPDSSKSGLKAKVNGATIVKDDTFGACLNFQGQDDHVEVSSVDGLGNPETSGLMRLGTTEKRSCDAHSNSESISLTPHGRTDPVGTRNSLRKLSTRTRKGSSLRLRAEW